MQPLVAFLIVAAVFAIGDIVSIKTKAIVSSLFVVSVLFLVGFWTFFPADIVGISTLLATANMAIPLLITHMGTLMTIRELIRQWKTVAVALAAVAGIGLMLFTVGGLVLDKMMALVAAPPVAGGVVASLIMSEAAKAKGMPNMAIFATLILVVQGFLGYPISTTCLLKEARRLLNNRGAGAPSGDAKPQEASQAKKVFPPTPKEFSTPFVLLAKLAVMGYVAVWLAGKTNGIIHPFVMSLIVGIIASELGILERDIMTRANAFGYLILPLTAVIMANLAKATPQVLASLIGPVLISLALGIIGIAVFAIVAGRVLGLSSEMSLAIGSTCLFGFPGTFVVSQEVARAVAGNDEERQYILDHILPKMLVAGFTTVTVASVVLAGIFAKLV
ncbi:MAG: hypothetical protein HPY55_00555 [Firmicutes bacterium]|nr:hypothetical protein [Bacillota bacterium]